MATKDKCTSATATIEAFQSHNQSKPEPRPYRHPVVELFRWQLQAHCNTGKPLNTSFDAHCCKIPFEDLKPIKLSEMEIPKIHLGRYLVCRVIGKPVTEIAAHTLFEDLDDDVEEASFSNFHYKITDLDWISVGTIFVIKEPWLQYSRSNTPFLRIDSPSDVIFVDPTDENFLDKIGAKQWYDESASKDPEVWCQKANEFFKNGKYEKALFLYDRGIRCNPDLAVLYLNKSLTCLKIGAFYAAYESAKLGMEKGGDRKKALYRLGQAAYGMREWQKAAKHFCEVLKESSQNSDASEQLKRATDRLKEERTGKFDFKSMFIESKKENKSKLDVADYMGPIEIANIPGKGRGIIASTDIPKGTLLVVSKSIGSGYDRDVPQSFFSYVDYAGNDISGRTQVLQAIDTIQYLKKNPQKAKEIYDLYSGDSDTVETEEIPDGVIDAARLENINALNRFDQFYGNGKDSTHLFILPSYFNHSCLANAFQKIFENVMFVHACADIKKGEEILIAYVDPIEEYSVRKKKCSEWKFTCQCKLCEIDSKDEFCAKRYQLYEEFCEFVKTNKNSQKDIEAGGEKFLKKMRKTYSKRNQFKTVLALLLFHLLFKINDLTKFSEYMEEFATVADGYLGCALDIAHAYKRFAKIHSNHGNSVKAEEMTQKAFEMSFCADMEHFKMVYP